MIQLSPHTTSSRREFQGLEISKELSSCQVLLSIGGRICACAVTGVPEERFHPGAEDPASDEAQRSETAHVA